MDECCCFSYIITKILWFSCTLTKVAQDLHLIHLIQKKSLSQKKRESPYCVQRTSGALTGWLSSQHTKGQKCKIALRKGSFSTAIGKSGKHTEDK